MSVRRAWIERDAALAVSRQCELAGVARSWVYGAVGEVLDEMDLWLLELIDAQYTRRPFYGSRRMVLYLQTQGHAVNRKRVQRLMRVLGLAGMAPGPNTSRPHPEHKIYPYLLRGVAVVRPNQVWSTDITYIRLEHGFAYLVAIIDWYARRVLAWRVSNTLEAGFCVDCLEDALRTHGRPEVFNSDQGSQFTSEAFTGVLRREAPQGSILGSWRTITQAGFTPARTCDLARPHCPQFLLKETPDFHIADASVTRTGSDLFPTLRQKERPDPTLCLTPLFA